MPVIDKRLYLQVEMNEWRLRNDLAHKYGVGVVRADSIEEADWKVIETSDVSEPMVRDGILYLPAGYSRDYEKMRAKVLEYVGLMEGETYQQTNLTGDEENTGSGAMVEALAGSLLGEESSDTEESEREHTSVTEPVEDRLSDFSRRLFTHLLKMPPEEVLQLPEILEDDNTRYNWLVTVLSVATLTPQEANYLWQKIENFIKQYRRTEAQNTVGTTLSVDENSSAEGKLADEEWRITGSATKETASVTEEKKEESNTEETTTADMDSVFDILNDPVEQQEEPARSELIGAPTRYLLLLRGNASEPVDIVPRRDLLLLSPERYPELRNIKQDIGFPFVVTEKVEEYGGDNIVVVTPEIVDPENTIGVISYDPEFNEFWKKVETSLVSGGYLVVTRMRPELWRVLAPHIVKMGYAGTVLGIASHGRGNDAVVVINAGDGEGEV